MSLGRAALAISVVSTALLVTSTCALGQAASPSETPKTAQSHDQVPLEMLRVVIAPGTRDAFFTSLRTFAERFGFPIRIAPTTPSGKDFATQMYREDIKVLGANPFRADTFELAFFASCPGNADATTHQDVTLAVAELKAILTKTQGVVVQGQADNGVPGGAT